MIFNFSNTKESSQKTTTGQQKAPMSTSPKNSKVDVYCRIRGPPLTVQDPCVQIEGENSVIMTPPTSSRAYTFGQKASKYIFKK